MTKLSRAQRRESAKARMNDALGCLTMQANLWKERWDEAPNPFVAVARYFSFEERARRKPIIDAFISARGVYYASLSKLKED